MVRAISGKNASNTAPLLGFVAVSDLPELKQMMPVFGKNVQAVK
jgi:hypothetical protein